MRIHIHMTRFELSVSKKHKKVLDIIDSWKQKGNAGDKICGLIEKAYEDEQRGSKITQFTGQQSKLPLLPPVYEEPQDSDLDGLTYNELRTVKFGASAWLSKAEKKIIAIQKQR